MLFSNREARATVQRADGKRTRIESEACIGGTKYPRSLEVNGQIFLINRQISP